jgi:hypothetical protein
MSIFRKFAVCFISPVRSAEFVDDKKRTAFAMLSLVLLICMIPVMIFSGIAFHTTLNEVNAYLNSGEVPNFTLKNGVITSELTEPRVLRNGGDLLIFDTVSKYDEKKIEKEKSAIFIFKDRIVLKSEKRIQMIILKNYSQFSFTKQDLVDLVDLISSLKWLIWSFFMFLLFTLRYIGWLVIVTMLAIIGLGFNTSLQNRLRFGRVWVLSAYAMILPNIAQELLSTMGIVIPYSAILYFIVCSVILFLILRKVSYTPKSDLTSDSSGVI